MSSINKRPSQSKRKKNVVNYEEVGKTTLTNVIFY